MPVHHLNRYRASFPPGFVNVRRAAVPVLDDTGLRLCLR